MIRKKSEEILVDQVLCLSLLTNAVVWNTLYIEAACDRLTSESVEVRDEDLARLSPARSAHSGGYARYRLDLEDARQQAELRPLREPKG